MKLFFEEHNNETLNVYKINYNKEIQKEIHNNRI
jgi:hypothetical protein